MTTIHASHDMCDTHCINCGAGKSTLTVERACEPATDLSYDFLALLATDSVHARQRGFTRHVLIDGECSTINGLIRPDADLDGAFEVWDIDASEWLTVSGWLADSIENVA